MYIVYLLAKNSECFFYSYYMLWQNATKIKNVEQNQYIAQAIKQKNIPEENVLMASIF